MDAPCIYCSGFTSPSHLFLLDVFSLLSILLQCLDAKSWPSIAFRNSAHPLSLSSSLFFCFSLKSTVCTTIFNCKVKVNAAELVQEFLQMSLISLASRKNSWYFQNMDLYRKVTQLDTRYKVQNTNNVLVNYVRTYIQE